MTRRSRARAVSLQLLFQCDYNPKIPRSLVEQFVAERLKCGELEEFCLGLFDGVVAKRDEIDRRLTIAMVNWRLPRLAAVDRNILRLGAFELLFRPDTPLAATINEAVELARRFGSEGSTAFVNGVLDRIAQEGALPPSEPLVSAQPAPSVQPEPPGS